MDSAEVQAKATIAAARRPIRVELVGERSPIAGVAHRGRLASAARLAIVQVPSQWRHRQKVSTVMTFASVSTALLLQNGHSVGRLTGSLNRDPNIVSPCPWWSTVAGSPSIVSVVPARVSSGGRDKLNA